MCLQGDRLASIHQVLEGGGPWHQHLHSYPLRSRWMYASTGKQSEVGLSMAQGQNSPLELSGFLISPSPNNLEQVT